MIFAAVCLFAIIACLGTAFCLVKLPGVANAIANCWQRVNGWMIVILGVAVFAFGFQGFMIKERSSSGGIWVAVYETVQLYFLNASEDASRGTAAQGTEEKEEKASNIPEYQTTLKLPNATPAESSHGSGDKQPSNVWILIAEMCAVGFVALLAFEAITLLFYGNLTNFRLVFTTDHLVICGYGRIGRSLVASYIEDTSRLYDTKKGTDKGLGRRRAVVVIDNSLTKDDIEWTKKHGVVVITGDAREKETLQAANVAWAHKVFVSTGEDEVNLEVATQIQEISGQNSWRLLESTLRWLDRGQDVETVVYVHLIDQEMVDIARPRLASAGREMRVEVFNTMDRTARLLIEELVKIPGIQPKSLKLKDSVIAQRNAAGKDSCSASIEVQAIPAKQACAPHIVIFGFDALGQALAYRLAELGHFGDCSIPRITILDRGIRKKARPFLARFPAFAQPLSLDDRGAKLFARHYPPGTPQNPAIIEFVSNADFVNYLEINDTSLQQRIQLWCAQSTVTFVFAFESSRENLVAAERLKAKLNQQKNNSSVFCWLGDTNGLSNIPDSRLEHSHPIAFGMCRKAITYSEVTDSWIERLARWINFSYSVPAHAKDYWDVLQRFFHRVRTEGAGLAITAEEHMALEKVEKETIVAWRGFEADPNTCEDFRHSNLSAATHAIVKLALVGIEIVGHQDTFQLPRPIGQHRENLLELSTKENPVVMEHHRWVAERMLRGWVYGPTKINSAKERPQIVDWDSLPDGEKYKDEKSVEIMINLCLSGLLRTNLSRGVDAQCDDCQTTR
jgi:hypothetical protein